MRKLCVILAALAAPLAARAQSDARPEILVLGTYHMANPGHDVHNMVADEIRIYRNIVALIESPSDRILVIYGAGHLGWLRQDASNDPSVKLRKLADFTAP
jgi:hypothetical protein